jgi:hypothetical protein
VLKRFQWIWEQALDAPALPSAAFQSQPRAVVVRLLPDGASFMQSSHFQFTTSHEGRHLYSSISRHFFTMIENDAIENLDSEIAKLLALLNESDEPFHKVEQLTLGQKEFSEPVEDRFVTYVASALQRRVSQNRP